MSLSTPKTTNPNTPGLSNAQSPSTLVNFTSTAQVNQIRGIGVLNAKGAGIPAQVSNVAASVANASTGLTSSVTVTFSQNSSDKNFSQALVLVKGYQGNPSPVQVASGTSSPIVFVINNTGESINVIVQATGNSGSAPITAAPSVGVKLPKSTGGGYGTKTIVTSTSGLTGDVVTTGTASPLVATVEGFQTVPISSVGPQTGDTWRYNISGDSKWDVGIGVPRFAQWVPDSAAATLLVLGSNVTTTNTGTLASVQATATDSPSLSFSASATGSTNIVIGQTYASVGTPNRYTLPTIYRFSIRLKLGNTTNVRYWAGLSNNSTNGTVWATDTPNQIYAAFRYSASTDTNIKAVCGTSSANQTVVDTGVAPQTSTSVLFEITFDGIHVNFWINGALVAQISSNIPSTSTNITWMWTGDNKNTATAISANWYGHTMVLK
jgi:hypothetical protein